MIHYTKGNILESDAMALVNTVNTFGVMGKGIALQFKSEFPHNFNVYISLLAKIEYCCAANIFYKILNIC